jgi:hypothetical protein
MSASLDGIVDEISHPAYSLVAAGARRRRERIEHKSKEFDRTTHEKERFRDTVELV